MKNVHFLSYLLLNNFKIFNTIIALNAIHSYYFQRKEEMKSSQIELIHHFQLIFLQRKTNH